MTRVNRPDTLLTELREIQRRLRLLEGTGARAAMAATTVTSVSTPSALIPARPGEWPATESPDWEGVVRTLVFPGQARLVVEAVSDLETTGQVRVVVGGSLVGEELSVTSVLTRHLVDLLAEDELTEIVVHARLTEGEGAVRVAALLLPG
jgi:uncharacterized protein (DUF736 family)